MVDLAAVRTALDRNDLDIIERAFRTLAEYPHGGGIEGVDSVETMTETLDRLVDGLSNDTTPMPSKTFDAIVRAKPNAMVEGASYADGARVVAAHRKHWHALFLMHLIPKRSNAPAAEQERRGEAATSIIVELSRGLAKGLDAFILAQPEAGLSRPEATRVILRHTLARLSYIDKAKT